MQPQQPNSNQEQEGPISFDMIMQMRNAARQQQGGSSQGQQNAAQRRLGQSPQEPQQPQELVNGQTPQDIMLADMEQELEANTELPEITGSAAKTMMRYGTIMDYLMRARGEMPDG